MNALALKLILILTVALTHHPQAGGDSEPSIIAGKGWEKICLGASRKLVSWEIGEEGIAGSTYDDVYFVEYPSRGLQISYTTSENKVANIYFYNKQRRYEHFATARVKTDKGIDWNSTPSQVIDAYGKPKEDYQGFDPGGSGWRRMVYDGI